MSLAALKNNPSPQYYRQPIDHVRYVRKTTYDPTIHRLREIEKIISYRHGVIPDTDDADIYLDLVCGCLARIYQRRPGPKTLEHFIYDRVDLWCERWAPDVSTKIRRDAAQKALRYMRLGTADQCAAQLRVSYEERTLLKLTTIGAYDVDKREREVRAKERKKARDRERMAQKRAANGSVSRAEYLTTVTKPKAKRTPRSESLSATKPWEAEGICRRTWERRRKSMNEKRNIIVVANVEGQSPSHLSSTVKGLTKKIYDTEMSTPEPTVLSLLLSLFLYGGGGYGKSVPWRVQRTALT